MIFRGDEFVNVTKTLPISSLTVPPEAPDSPVKLTMSNVAAVAGLRISVSGPDGVVHGACPIEHPDMVDELEAGWLVVSEGIGFGGANETDLRSFVRAIKIRSSPGLVIKLGRGWDQVPGPLINEAEHLELPVFIMPSETPVSSFLRYVHEAASINDLAILTQALSIQTELLAALSYPDVEVELVRRISGALDVSTVLYDAEFRPIAIQGDAPIHLIAEHIREHRSQANVTLVGRWLLDHGSIATPVGDYHLGLAWRIGNEPNRELVRSSRRAMEQLLHAHARTVALAQEQDHLQRAQVLIELLDGVDEDRLERLRDRLVLLHFPRDAVYQIHAIAIPKAEALDLGEESSRDDVDRLVLQAMAFSRKQQVDILIGRHRGMLVILHTGREDFGRTLVDALPEHFHGSSSTFLDLTESNVVLRQSETSLATSIRQGRFTPFHRVGFADFVLGHIPREELNTKGQQVLAELSRAPNLLDTLVEYLRHGMDIQATAQAMHLHPNSIRYRLSKAEEAIGLVLTDPETITVLYLSLNERIRDTTVASRAMSPRAPRWTA